jgi:hypothetical protein
LRQQRIESLPSRNQAVSSSSSAQKSRKRKIKEVTGVENENDPVENAEEDRINATEDQIDPLLLDEDITEEDIDVYANENNWIEQIIEEKKNNNRELRNRIITPDKYQNNPRRRQPVNNPHITKKQTFELFFDDEIMQTFVDNTNNFGKAKDPKFKLVTHDEILKFFGLIMFMGIVDIPQRRMYWGNTKYTQSFVKKTMSGPRFEEILKYMHWIDTSGMSEAQKAANNKENSFWSVEGFLDKLAQNCQSNYNLGFEIDIDEMCIHFKGRHRAKCYNPNKPERWHIKAFCLNDAKTGFLHNWFMYQGKDEQRPNGMSATMYPITRLLDRAELYHNHNHLLALDNWYTSIAAAVWLKDRGIDVTGTIKLNRKNLPNKAKLPKKGRNKKAKGYMHTYKCQDLYFTAWMDNNPVHILSTYKPNRAPVVRNTKGNNGTYQRVVLDRPTNIEDYNSAMGGTDLIDQLISYYRSDIKCDRWQPRIYFHFLQAMVVNACIIYRQQHTETKISLLDFIDGLIDELVPDWNIENHVREEDMELYEAPEMPIHHRGGFWKNDTSRLTGQHWPCTLASSERRRCIVCKNKHCKTLCVTCRSAVCCNNDSTNNCWYKFHFLENYNI